jgi:large subunit ribosomal protein L18
MWVKWFVRRLVRLLVNKFEKLILAVAHYQNQDRKIKYMDTKAIRRQRIKFGVRKKVSGTTKRPRLSVFRSNNDIYVQLIDDDNAKTLASASSKDKDILAQKGTKVEKSKLVGAAIARKASELGLLDVTFDRGGYLYHGRVKAVAEGAREGGLKF